MPEKTKVHTVYKLADGTRVPSVTTILNILNKPALLEWAYQCGLRGEDYKLVRDDAAGVGTLAHYLIMCHLRDVAPDTSEYSQNDLERAENCLIKYWDWEKEHKIEPALIEAPLISETFRFGGTIDCLAKYNDELWLVDYKTGKAIYPEMFYQLAAYRQLLKEDGYEVSSARILRIGRDETSDFEERIVTDLDKQFDLFLHCLAVYNIQKALRGEKQNVRILKLGRN